MYGIFFTGLRGMPQLCPGNYSWPEYLKTRFGAPGIAHVTAQWLVSCMEHADFRRVCLFSDTSERDMWCWVRLQAGNAEIE